MLSVLLLAALAADPAPPYAGRGAGTVPLWNPHKAAPGNPPLTVRVLVLNYDPLVPGEGHKRLSEVFKWGNPAQMATRYKEAMEHASGGYLRFDIVEWRNLDEIYHQDDGKTYTVAEYVKNRRAGKGWRERTMADYPRLIREQNVEPLIDDGRVDEVWVFSDHYFGLWEASMAGPGAFFINGGVYPRVPTRRPFAFYGFNYERGVAEMMHNSAHRVEATMNRAYGPWNLKDPKTNWDKFSANHDQSGGLAGVGTCHWPPNAKGDYDYGNTREVSSWADAFLTYPKLDLKRKTVSRATWSKGPDHHLDYMKWYFGHLPRAAGVNDDGRQNNWYKYVFDFQGYDAKGQPLPPSAEMLSGDIIHPKEFTHTVSIAFRSAEQIDPTSLRDALHVMRPGHKPLKTRLLDDGGPGGRSWRVARYGISDWPAGPAGDYSVHLRPDVVRTLGGKALGAIELGRIRYSRAGSRPDEIPSDVDTTFLAHFDREAKAGKIEPATAKGLTYEDGILGHGVAIRAGSKLSYPAKGVLDPKAGTLEFWLQPFRDGDSGKGRMLFHAGTPFKNGLVVQIDGANNLRLIIWDAKGKESGVGVSAARWKKGEWRHVAATWAGRKLALYVDGAEAASTAAGVELTAFSALDFWVGGTPGGGDPADAVFDEFRISRMARSAAEVRIAMSALGDSLMKLTAPATMLPGGRAVARAEGLRDLTRAVAWSSSKERIVSVDDAGNLRAMKAGTAEITARLGKMQESVTVKVEDPGLPTARLSAEVAPVKVGGAAVTFRVAYASKAGFREGAVTLGSVRVAGPGGFNGFPEVVKVADGVAEYRLAPRTEKWADADVGTYTIEAKAFHVTDKLGHSVPESVLGRFEVKK